MRIAPTAAGTALTGRLTALVGQQIDLGLAPGVQLFVSHDGQVLVDAAVGRRVPDGAELTTRTRLCVWSAAKPVTATAVHLLVERGGLTYADRVCRHIPELDGGGRESITVRHLLLHQAGIPDTAGTVGPAAHLDPEALTEQICALPLEFEPGSRVEYHPLTASALLAEVVARVDGRPFAAFCAAEIFGPLGMERTTWGLEPALVPDASSLVSIADGAVLDLAADPLCTAVVPGAGLWTTAGDLGRFYECWRRGGRFDGSRLLSRATVEHATTNYAAIGDLPSFGFGYGFMVGTAPEANPSRGVLCSPRTFGHPGAQCSVALCDPEHDLVIAFLANGSPGQDESDRRFGILCDEVYRAVL